MSNLIFNVHETYIEIAKVSKILNVVKIKKVINFTPSIDTERNSVEDNGIMLKKILRRNKFTSKKVDVILSIDSIVTRQIEVPAMKDKDLKDFINNNMDDYFTVNTEDFYFDYKISGIRKEENKKIFSVLLVAVPKEKIDNVKNLLTQNRLHINKVKIYPECVLNYYKKNKKQSIAVLDIGKDKSSITISDKGKIFIYSSLFLDMSDVDSYSELTDNYTYFLNFYSTRNFGNKVDKIYLVGDKSEDERLRKTLNDSVDNNIIHEMDNNYIEILGSTMENRAINNKPIAFKQALNDKPKDKGQNLGIILFIMGIILLLSLGAGGYYYSEIYLNNNKNSDEATLQSDINKYASVEKDITDLNKEKQNYQKKVDVINEVNQDEFNYVSIIDGIKKGLPKNITVKSIEIQREKTNVTLNIDNNTLDVARAVIAINNTKLFETIDISEVKLDDTVKSITLDLKFKDPS